MRPVFSGGPSPFEATAQGRNARGHNAQEIKSEGWTAMTRSNRVDHIRITSHPTPGGKLQFPIQWGAASARERGPIIGTVSRPRAPTATAPTGVPFRVHR